MVSSLDSLGFAHLIPSKFVRRNVNVQPVTCVTGFLRLANLEYTLHSQLLILELSVSVFLFPSMADIGFQLQKHSTGSAVASQVSSLQDG